MSLSDSVTFRSWIDDDFPTLMSSLSLPPSSWGGGGGGGIVVVCSEMGSTAVGKGGRPGGGGGGIGSSLLVVGLESLSSPLFLLPNNAAAAVRPPNKLRDSAEWAIIVIAINKTRRNDGEVFTRLRMQRHWRREFAG